MSDLSLWLQEILRLHQRIPESARRDLARRLDGFEDLGHSVAGLDLGAVNWCDRNLAGLSLSGCKLRGASLAASSLNGASFVLADLRGADFRGSLARGADFRGADLREANLDDVDATGADLRAADVRLTCARNANFRGARLEGALMQKLGEFEYPQSEGPFGRANLAGATFDRATIERSDWDAADIAAAHAVGMLLLHEPRESADDEPF